MSAAQPPHPPPPAGASWRRFAVDFCGMVVLAGLALILGVALLDPYGLRAAPGRAPGPIMDANQRFTYPQIARGGGYDAAVFGTSTARLIDPKALDAVFPARFANLAMNAATPYEQTRLARLFLRAAPARAVLFALDAPWCEAEADRRRTTALPFPDWLYEPAPARSILRQVNGQGVAVAARVALHRLGLVPARIRADGYAVFTPPEAQYDPIRAAAHIRAGAAMVPTAAGEPNPQEGTAMPALAWLDGLLAETPADALKLVAFMPLHAAVQGRPGTAQGAREAACKAQVAAIGRARGALVVDFRIPSPVTRLDTNYWDPLHYRLPVADRIVAGLTAARAEGRDDPEGVYRVLARP